jgi:hypothetical protein
MLTAVLLTALIAQTPPPVPKPKEDPKPPAPAARAETPEETFRSFLFAMITQDEQGLRDRTLPHDEFEWLLKGEAPPRIVHEQIKDQVSQMPVQLMKAGDEFTLPDGRKEKILPEEVAEDRAVVLPQGSPIPARLEKVDGRWRIDAAPIIAARKAADAARKKAEEAAKKGQTGKPAPPRP